MKYLPDIKNIYYFFCLWIFLLILNGCKDNPVENIIKPKTIKKVTTSPDDYSEYFYTSGLLTNKGIISSAKLSYNITLSYDKFSRLIKKEEVSFNTGIPVHSYTTYEYGSLYKLQRSSYFAQSAGGNYELRSYTTYKYDNDNLTRYQTYDGTTNELMTYDEFKYNSSGNIIGHKQHNGNDDLKLNETFEYDGKPNALNSDLSILSAASISKNNIIKSTFTNYNTFPPGLGTTQNSYSYNNEDYPEACISVYEISWKGITSRSTINYKYEYN